MKYLIVVYCVLLLGCSKSSTSSSSSTSSKLKEFLAKSDVVLVRRYFDRVTVKSVTPPNEPGSVSLRYTPGFLSLQPETVEEMGKPSPRMKGAYLTVQEYKWTISGGLSGPERGPDVSDESAIDDDELVDLENAIQSMQRSAAEWKSSAPKVHTEISFEARDRFALRLIQGSPASYEARIGRATVEINESGIDQLLRGVQGINETLKAN